MKSKWLTPLVGTSHLIRIPLTTPHIQYLDGKPVAAAQPRAEAASVAYFQFHLPKPDVLRIRPPRPSPGIQLVPGGGLQLHFGLPGTRVAAKLNLIPVLRHTSPQLIA